MVERKRHCGIKFEFLDLTARRLKAVCPEKITVEKLMQILVRYVSSKWPNRTAVKFVHLLEFPRSFRRRQAEAERNVNELSGWAEIEKERACHRSSPPSLGFRTQKCRAEPNLFIKMSRADSARQFLSHQHMTNGSDCID